LGPVELALTGLFFDWWHGGSPVGWLVGPGMHIKLLYKNNKSNAKNFIKKNPTYIRTRQI